MYINVYENTTTFKSIGKGLRIMTEEVVGEAVEELRFLWWEETTMDLINGLLQLRIALVVLARIIPRYVCVAKLGEAHVTYIQFVYR